MIIDDPRALAEVTIAFHAYEKALMDDDLAALDALFHHASTTTRYGVGEALYGIEAIRAFRLARGGSPQRRLGRLAITAYGDAFATTHVEFARDGSDRRGRQTQAWVKFAEGWKIVSAHVSFEGTTA